MFNNIMLIVCMNGKATIAAETTNEVQALKWLDAERIRFGGTDLRDVWGDGREFALDLPKHRTSYRLVYKNAPRRSLRRAA